MSTNDTSKLYRGICSGMVKSRFAWENMFARSGDLNAVASVQCAIDSGVLEEVTLQDEGVYEDACYYTD